MGLCITPCVDMVSMIYIVNSNSVSLKFLGGLVDQKKKKTIIKWKEPKRSWLQVVIIERNQHD